MESHTMKRQLESAMQPALSDYYHQKWHRDPEDPDEIDPPGISATSDQVQWAQSYYVFFSVLFIQNKQYSSF